MSAGPLRVALCDDSGIFRQGLALLLQAAGLTVVASVGTGTELILALESALPDVVVLDVRMPPTHTDEGIQLAADLRGRHATLGILVLSTYADPVWATRLLARVPSAVGYLLKDRVTDVAVLVDALHRVTAGDVTLDVTVVTAMMAAARSSDPLARLTAAERDVLALLAEGHSNEAIAQRRHLSVRTVESHVAAIFRTLDLDATRSVNRRVQAAVAFLDAHRHGGAAAGG